MADRVSAGQGETCRDCGGHGWITEPGPEPDLPNQIPCERCYGTGFEKPSSGQGETAEQAAGEILRSLNQLTDHGSQGCLDCLEHRRVGMAAVERLLVRVREMDKELAKRPTMEYVRAVERDNLELTQLAAVTETLPTADKRQSTKEDDREDLRVLQGATVREAAGSLRGLSQLQAEELADLRLRVRELTDERDDAERRVKDCEDRNAHKRRADIAERRVQEAERALRAFWEMWDEYNHIADDCGGACAVERRVVCSDFATAVEMQMPRAVLVNGQPDAVAEGIENAWGEGADA